MINSSDIQKCSSFLGTIEKDYDFSITTDSRNIGNENTFFSLYGPNFDSVEFLDDVISKGIKFIFIEFSRNQEKIEAYQEKYPEILFFNVTNIFKFLLELGHQRAIRFREDGGIIVSLTGSNGKTTNKEMLKHILSFLDEEKVLATKGNLNNQIGVPLTLFQLNSQHEVAVIEIGTNFPGEIEILSQCAYPQFGYITNIGYAHLEKLKSLDGVFQEKTALFREIKSNGQCFLINGFDDYLKNLKGESKTVFVGEQNCSIDEDKKSITINNSGKLIVIKNETLNGLHQFINLAMMTCLAIKIFPERIGKIVERAQSYRPITMNRGEIIEKGNCKVFLDAYNANPSSMIASLKGFMSLINERGVDLSKVTVILGDMNELGADAIKYHEELGSKLKDLGIKKAIFIGRFAERYQKGFGEPQGMFASVKDVGHDYFNALCENSDFIFIKGSRSLQLESLVAIKKG